MDTELTVHHFDMACNQCHIEPTQDSPKPVGELFGDRNQMCMQCHPIDKILNHPVGVTAPAQLDNALPLDQNSNITCLTCHEETPVYDKGFEPRQPKPNFLRRQGIALCGSCHGVMSSTLRQRAHWQFAIRAHLDTRINSESDTPHFSEADDSYGLMDVESRTCLSCHDDMATAVGYNPLNNIGRFTTQKEHPIGIDYAQVALSNIRDYHFPLRAQSRIRLFSGKLGCGSCHSLYNTKSDYLVINDDAGALCQECHIK